MEPNECGIQDLEVERVERRTRSSLGQCTDRYLCERGCRLSAEHGLLKIYLFPFFKPLFAKRESYTSCSLFLEYSFCATLSGPCI